MADGNAETRSVLNAVAALRAGQEQMQGDIDRLRAATHALIVFAVYGIAAAALAFFLYKKGSPA